MSRFEDYIKMIAPNIHIPSYAKRFENVVEVVRCKDCKWYYILNGHDRCDLLDLEARDIKPDWFCADGERKEDEQLER